MFTVGLVPSMRNHPVGIPLTRTRQQNRRPGVKGDADICRMEATQRTLLTDQQVSGTLQHGSFCQSAKPPVTQVHQLEARPRSSEYRCLPELLERSRGICIPSICLNRQMFPKDKGGTEYSSTDCSNFP